MIIKGGFFRCCDCRKMHALSLIWMATKCQCGHRLFYCDNYRDRTGGKPNADH